LKYSSTGIIAPSLRQLTPKASFNRYHDVNRLE
jgi:hypothetical protein